MVRINGNDPLQKLYPQENQPKRKDDSAKRSDSIVNSSSADSTGVSRDERIERLKADFQAGKPIDVNKLADTLVKSGIFFNVQG